jgi:hypothetical protein
MLLVSSMSECWRRSFCRFLSPSQQARLLFNRTQILYSPGNFVTSVVLRTLIKETYYVIQCFMLILQASSALSGKLCILNVHTTVKIYGLSCASCLLTCPSINLLFICIQLTLLRIICTKYM